MQTLLENMGVDVVLPGMNRWVPLETREYLLELVEVAALELAEAVSEIGVGGVLLCNVGWERSGGDSDESAGVLTGAENY